MRRAGSGNRSRRLGSLTRDNEPMTVFLTQHDTPADAPSLVWRDAAIVAVAVLLTMTLPLAIYGYLSWQRFEYFSLSYFVPYEAMRAELESATLTKVVSLPLVEMNMTSGHILANMYTLTLGQFVLSSMLGLVMGLVIAEHLRLRSLCALRGQQSISAAAGAGLLATVAAASTGLLGCCGGSAFAGGVFALAGLSSASAAALSKASPIIQIGLILVFVVLYAGLKRKRATLEALRRSTGGG
jgi:hypothetical protein